MADLAWAAGSCQVCQAWHRVGGQGASATNARSLVEIQKLASLNFYATDRADFCDF